MPKEKSQPQAVIDPGAGSQMVEVIPSTDLLAISKAEIDVQITTAKQFPRELEVFMAGAGRMVATSQEVAETMFYKLPRKNKDGSTKIIEGPSVRFAEIINQNWRNCRAGARVLGTDEKFVVSQGVFHDLETNVAVSFEIKRRITGRDGSRYGDDMIQTTGAAAAGIAFRNAVLKGIPKLFWGPLYDKALDAARPAPSALAERVKLCLDSFKSIGVSEAAILKTLRVKKIGTDELITLRGIWNAIKEGTTTPHEAFGDNPIEPTTEAVKAPKKNPGSDRDKKAATAVGDVVAAARGVPAAPPAAKSDPIIGSKEQTEVYNQAIQHGWQVPEQVVAFLKAKYQISGIREIRASVYKEIIARMKKPPAEDIL